MAYLEIICGTKLFIESKVGRALIRQFEIRFPDDPGYVLGKAETIKDMDTAGCLLKWYSLDDEGQEVFVEQLGMPRDLLVQTCEGIKWLYND